MAKSFLIIDGYNLLHSAGMAASRYGPGDLQRARERLLKYLLRNLTPAERERATIVFDAHDAPPDQPHAWTVSGMQIRFASPDGDADAMIEDLIASHAAPRQVLVVSSDHRLQVAARKRRSAFVDSDVFVSDLDRRAARSAGAAASSPTANAAKPVGPQSDEEVAAWLKVFGNVSPAEIERELRRAVAERPLAGVPESTSEAPRTPAKKSPPAPPASSTDKVPGESAPQSEKWIQELQDWVDNLGK